MARQTPSLTITNASIVTQNRRREIKNGNIRIVDGRIAEISTKSPARGSKVLNAGGLVILPGFVQTHVHLCQTLFRNAADDLDLLDWLKKKIWVYESRHTSETLSTSAWLGIHELLSSGTTCLLDMGTVRHTEAILQAVKESGIRANVGKCLMDNPKTCPKGLLEPTGKALLEATELFDEWNGTENDRIRVSYAPRFVISCTEELLSAVAQIARGRKALVHTHASESLRETKLVKSMVGYENVEYLHKLGLTGKNLVLAHCIWLSKKEMGILRKTRTNVAHCPSSNLKLASGIAKTPELRKLGINVSLGADGAPCNNNLNMFQEMRLAALIQKPGHGPKAMRAQEVLDMATLNGAKALQWDDDIGSLEVGKKADLFAIDLNSPSNFISPLLSRNDPSAYASAIVYSSQPSHVQWTMVDGKVVYRNGQLTAKTVDRFMR